MARLILESKAAAGRADIDLTLNQTLRIGRRPQSGFEITWDQKISRDHADLVWNGRMLSVVCLDAARNPIQLDGEVARQILVPIGRSFIIGETEFLLQNDVDEQISFHSEAATERTFRQKALEEFRFRDANEQIELLSSLPRIMDDSPEDEQFAARLVELLIEGVPRADAAAVVQYELTEDDAETVSDLSDRPSMMRVATRVEFMGAFRPSRTLILSTLQKRESTSHLWDEAPGAGGAGEFTISEGLNWAFCTPILADSCRGWSLYVSGREAVTHEELGGDLRFAELMAQFIGSDEHRVSEGVR